MRDFTTDEAIQEYCRDTKPAKAKAGTPYLTGSRLWTLDCGLWIIATLALLFTIVAGASHVQAQAVTADINVKLQPVMQNIDLVTDINLVGNSLFVCTQPGKLYRKNLAANTTPEVFLDLRSEVGRLGTHVPGLPGLGYPDPETYDERGLLGFVADPNFDSNGRFWVWYSNIGERSASPPGFFQWLVSTTNAWNMAEYDHVDHLAEYKVVQGVPMFQRTLLKLKRPYFNHTGFQSLAWSPEFNTLVLGLGDGGSEYDPNNIAQDDEQLSGKLLRIDLQKLQGADFTSMGPVATFSDLQNQGVPDGAFTTLVKGLRNPSKLHHEQIAGGEEGGNGQGNGKENGKGNGKEHGKGKAKGNDKGPGDGNGKGNDDGEDNGNNKGRQEARYIKYLANTGQDTIEFVHGFENYGINFGFRPWEGIFPNSFNINNTRVIAYGLEASRLPNIYRPLVEYTHLDPDLFPNANTGSALYRGQSFPGLSGQLVFTDWISFAAKPPHGLLMHAPVDRDNLQVAQQIKLFNVDLSAVNLQSGDVLFYTSINTDRAGGRIFIGGFKNLQFIVSQRDNPLQAGGVYEVVSQ
jgi:hypothetical protein